MSARAPIRVYFSPSTGGIVLDNGTPREDITAASMVLMRLSMVRGSSPLLMIGSRLRSIVKIDKAHKVSARDYIIEALSDLVDRGDIRDVVTSVEFAALGRITYVVAYVDRANKTQAVRYTYRTGAG